LLKIVEITYQNSNHSHWITAEFAAIATDLAEVIGAAIDFWIDTLDALSICFLCDELTNDFKFKNSKKQT
jgi:hypothetical protein